MLRGRIAGGSFPDLLMARGEYRVRQQLPFSLGCEAAGDVVKAPAGSRFGVGDRVMTLSFGVLAVDPAVRESAIAQLDDLVATREIEPLVDRSMGDHA